MSPTRYTEEGARCVGDGTAWAPKEHERALALGSCEYFVARTRCSWVPVCSSGCGSTWWAVSANARAHRVIAIALSFLPGAISGWLRDADQIAWVNGSTAFGG